MTITVINVLQPYAGETFVKALQRVAGTVAGGLLAAGIAAAIHDPRAIFVIVALLAATCVALMPINYALFTLFLTPTFVLLAELGTGDWHLARWRVFNTLLGGALALAGSRLLWPSPERTRFPEATAEALRAYRAYVERVGALWRDDAPADEAALADTRRRMGLAAINAETSLQRLLTESPGGPEAMEPLVALLVYLRRFGAALIPLPTTGRRTVHAHQGMLVRGCAEVASVLEELAGAVGRGRPPGPLPDLEQLLRESNGHARAAEPRFGAEDALLATQLERVARQLTVLHGAVARLSAPEREHVAPA